MTVLIVDPDGQGHHVDYICKLYRALTRMGVSARWLTTARTTRDRAVVDRSHDLEGLTIEAGLPDSASNSLIANWDTIESVRQHVRERSTDRVFLMFGDPLLVALGARRLVRRGAGLGVPTEALFFRATLAYRRYLRKPKAALLARQYCVERSGVDHIHVLDPVAAAGYPAFGDGAPAASVLPDPVELPSMTRADARAFMGLDPSDRCIGLPGAIDRRKGWPQLLRCLPTLSRARVKVCLLGPHETALRQTLDRDYRDAIRRGDLLSFDRQLSGAEMADLMTAFDVIACPYPSHVGSSSTILRAAAASVPVVTSATPWTTYIVTKFALGALSNIEDAEQFSDSLIEAATRGLPADGRAGRQALLDFHSPSNFGAHLTARLASRLGRAVPPPLSWQNVVGDAPR